MKPVLYNFYVIAVIVISIGVVKAQNKCPDEVGETRKCVPVLSCSQTVDILMKFGSKLPTMYQKYFQRFYCGFENNEHHICCSDRYIIKKAKNETTAADDDDNNADGDTINRGEFEEISGHPSLKLLTDGNCGKVEKDKVSGGNDTALGEYPWMVSLLYEQGSELVPRCGASLISRRYVLTAAHCIKPGNTPVRVRVGEHDMSKDIDCDEEEDFCAPAVQDIPIAEIRSHPRFGKPRFANDIAVIRLARDVQLNSDTVMPICLPISTELQYAPVKRLTIAGWGLTEKQNVSSLLQKASLPVVSNDECQRRFRRQTRITAAQMCAGGETGVDSCHGDSGGPLFSMGTLPNIIAPKIVQYGVISFGVSECGNRQNFPGVYTRVAFYMKWILDQLQA